MAIFDGKMSSNNIKINVTMSDDEVVALTDHNFQMRRRISIGACRDQFFGRETLTKAYTKYY